MVSWHCHLSIARSLTTQNLLLLLLLLFQDAVCEVLVPLLERSSKSDPLWQRIGHKLFSRVPDKCLESVLNGVLFHVTP